MSNEKKDTKTCIKCKGDIPKTSWTCPLCKKYQVSRNQWIALGIFAFVLILGMIASKSGESMVDTNAPREKQVKQVENLKPKAFVIAQDFVKDRLKSPSTAKFQWRYDKTRKDQVIWISGNKFLVKTEVDAQNSFGATIREVFGSVLEYKGKEGWKLLDIGSYEEVGVRILSPMLNKETNEDEE